MRKLIVPAIIVALLIAAGLTMFSSPAVKTLTAHFPRTISIYEGSDVRVLGVPVGNVDTVTPDGTDVVVTMHYDASVKVPANAKAVIIAPSIVGDRFVQLTPVYEGGQTLADGATLQQDETAVPLELDQIYASMDQLTVALGPTGANKNGALSDLLEQTAKNFKGQGLQFHQTISDFGKFSKTLADNRQEFFGSAAALEGFISKLAQNDKTVRSFNQSLSQVAGVLKGERGELSASLRNLAEAMTQVSSFVKENRDILGRNIDGLNRVSKVLVKQRAALAETLRDAPLALNNLYMTYNPQAGTLDTRSNMEQSGSVIASDPAAFLCSVVDQADQSGTACQFIKQAFPRTTTFGKGSGQAPTQVDPYDPTLGGLVEAHR
jgi:phospholipid/cholesterol/gamma-HCH transport system substrate-binding protein